MELVLKTKQAQKSGKSKLWSKILILLSCSNQGFQLVYNLTFKKKYTC